MLSQLKDYCGGLEMPKAWKVAIEVQDEICHNKSITADESFCTGIYLTATHEDPPCVVDDYDKTYSPCLNRNGKLSPKIKRPSKSRGQPSVIYLGDIRLVLILIVSLIVLGNHLLK